MVPENWSVFNCMIALICISFRCIAVHYIVCCVIQCTVAIHWTVLQGLKWSQFYTWCTCLAPRPARAHLDGNLRNRALCFSLAGSPQIEYKTLPSSSSLLFSWPGGLQSGHSNKILETCDFSDLWSEYWAEVIWPTERNKKQRASLETDGMAYYVTLEGQII